MATVFTLYNHLQLKKKDIGVVVWGCTGKEGNSYGDGKQVFAGPGRDSVT